MTDLREQIEDVLYREDGTPIPLIADAIMAALTPGTRFTGADGREMVVVPVEQYVKTCGDAYRQGSQEAIADLTARFEKALPGMIAKAIAAASEPDAPSQDSERGE